MLFKNLFSKRTSGRNSSTREFFQRFKKWITLHSQISFKKLLNKIWQEPCNQIVKRGYKILSKTLLLDEFQQCMKRIIHHDSWRFILETRGWFSKGICSKIIHFINWIKDKIFMIILIDVEKHLVKINILFWLK